MVRYMSIFREKNYRDIIEQRRSKTEERGYLSKLAKAMRCHRSTLPQVLSGRIELTLDQAADLAHFWEFNPQETEFFLDLVAHARATSRELKKLIERRLETARVNAADLAKNLPAGTVDASKTVDPIYYTSTNYSAVHVLTSIPAYQTLAALSTHLGLAESVVEKILQHLKRLSLVTYKNGKWTATAKSIHLARDTEYYKLNNRNWRLRALNQLDTRDSTGSVAYTGVHSLSLDLKEELQREIFALIKDFHHRMGPSPAETCVCLNVDFFEI